MDTNYLKPEFVDLIEKLNDLTSIILDKVFPLEKIIEDTENVSTADELISFYEKSMDDLLVNAYTFNPCERNFYVSLLFIQNTLVNENLIVVQNNELKEMLMNEN